MRLLILALALLSQLTSAIYADEAGSIDYHLALLGQPGNASTFFHQPVPGSKASLIYTLSERNVLGAVNPKDGSVVWRQVLSNNRSAPHGRLSSTSGQDVLYTAVGDTAGAWSASDGRFIWDARYKEASVRDVATLDSEEGRNGKVNGDAVALWAGKNSVLQRLDADTGVVRWTHEETSGSNPYRVAASGGEVYIVGLTKSMLKGYKLHVTDVEAKSGKAKDQVTLSSDSEITSEHDILHVGSVGKVPVAIWTDASKTTIKVNVLGSKNIASFDVGSSAEPVTQVAVKCSSDKVAPPHFLIESRTSKAHGGQVFHIDAPADVKKAKISKAYDLPHLQDQGTFASSAAGTEVYFVRLASEVQIFSSSSHGILARWPLKLRDGSVADPDVWSPAHAASEVVARPDSTYAVRSTVLRSSGDWSLIRNGEEQWVRPEQLASIVNAQWVETNASNTIVEELKTESVADPVSAFLHRFIRHISDAAHMPALLQTLPQAIVDWISSFTQSGHSKNRSFGFDKQLHALLENGDIVSIDMEPQVIVRKVQEEGSRSKLRASLGGHTSDLAEGGYSYHLEEGGLSGKGPNGASWHFTPRPGHEIFDTVAPAESHIASIGKVLGDRSVLYKYLNPNAILVLSKNPAAGQLTTYLLDTISGSVLHAEDHEDVDLSRPVSASIAENWYSYTFAFDTKSDALSRGYLLFMAEAYESEFPNDRGPLGTSGNYSTIDPSTATAGALTPHVITQMYHIPQEVSSMAVTQTRQGITSRQLLLKLANSPGIVGIPHQVLDPRRPVGRAATNKEMEEGLMQYSPVIDFDPKIYLTHTNDVLGIDKVVSSPTDMESTSLVFAYGLDIFSTRVTPSFAFDVLGSSFNKIQLIVTVVALTAGVFAVAPLIKRKQTNALWQQSS